MQSPNQSLDIPLLFFLSFCALIRDRKAHTTNAGRKKRWPLAIGDPADLLNDLNSIR